jgi:hypothetical protein
MKQQQKVYLYIAIKMLNNRHLYRHICAFNFSEIIYEQGGL